jgi:hypothetical protein
MERAAAPEERIVVDDPVLQVLLPQIGGADLGPKRVVYRHKGTAGDLLPLTEEIVLVARESDPLIAELRAKGCSVWQDAVWDETGMANRVPGSGAVRIYFVVPAAAR